MNRRHLIDTRTAAGILLGVLQHHLGRPVAFADFAIAEDACGIVGDKFRLVVETTDHARTRFFVDIDADTLPQIRAMMGTVSH